jgi:hypothetical protein
MATLAHGGPTIILAPFDEIDLVTPLWLDADDLAECAAKILGRIESLTVSRRNKQLVIRGKNHLSAKMASADGLGGLPAI